MFANRNNNIGNNYSNDDIDNRDLEALLNALIGNNNTSWVGKNCNYGSAPPCSISTNTIDSSEIYGRTIPVPESLFSKCYFIPVSSGSSYPLNNHNITNSHKKYDCDIGSTSTIGSTSIHGDGEDHVHYIPYNS